MPVKFEKSAYDAIEPDVDGVRIVATRFWPRGLSKAARNLYLPDLAPSEPLMRGLQAGEIAWSEFAKRYRAEMKDQRSLIRTLGWMSGRGETLTVMCSCEKPGRCHRSLLAALIEKAD